MPYTPDPTDVNNPTDLIVAETAAAEFRALKQYIHNFITGGTSTTSLTVGVGDQVLTTTAGLPLYVGQKVLVVATANTDVYMYGKVKTYSSTSLTVTVSEVSGSGTYASWNICPTGPKGATGAQGAQGSQGVPGSWATVAVGTVTTLPAGSGATITNIGTSTAAVFDFGIPKGDTGDQGDVGPQGPVGPAGSVDTVTETGTGLSVDSTDPANPVISMVYAEVEAQLTTDGFAKLSSDQTWTGVQTADTLALTSGVAWDASDKQHLTVDVNGGNFSVVNCTGAIAKSLYLVYITFTTSHQIVWGSMYKNTSTLSLSNTAGYHDAVLFRFDGTNMERIGVATNVGA